MKKSPIRVDTDSIPEHVRNGLLEVIYEATKEFFAQPGTEEKFQEWLTRRNNGKER